MNLETILIEAAAGFASGFALGASIYGKVNHTIESAEEELSEIDNAPEELTSKLKHAKKGIRKSKISFTGVGFGFGALINNALYKEPYQAIIAGISTGVAAYLGIRTGEFVSRLFRKRHQMTEKLSLDELFKKENFRILVVNGENPIDKKLHKKLTKKGYTARKTELQPRAVNEIVKGGYDFVFINNKKFVPEQLALYALGAATLACTKAKNKPQILMTKGNVDLEKVYEFAKLAHARKFFIESTEGLAKEIRKIDLEQVIAMRMHLLQDSLFQPEEVKKDIIISKKNPHLPEIEMNLINAYQTAKKKYNQDIENETLTQLIKCLEGTYSILFEENIETATKEFYNPKKIKEKIKDKKELKEFKLEDHMISSKGADKLAFVSVGNLPIYNHVLFIIQHQDNYLVYDVIAEDGAFNLADMKLPYIDLVSHGPAELKEEELPELIDKAKKEEYLSVIAVKDRKPNDIDKEQKLSLAFQAYLLMKNLILTKMSEEPKS